MDAATENTAPHPLHRREDEDDGAHADGRTTHAALAAARTALADQQDKEGGWTGDAAAATTRWEAVDVLVHHLLDAVDRGRVAEQRARIVVRQNDDGGFPLRAGEPSDLSSTLLTHVALQLIGHAEDRAALDHAARFARRHGGIDAADAEPARFWLAFTGAVGWDRTAPMPPELLLLPSWAPGAADDSDPPLRALAAAVGILGAVRPVRELPVDVTSLHAGKSTLTALRGAAATTVLRTAHTLARLSPRPLRRRALSAAEHLLLNGQDTDGGWGGDGPATAVCVLALWALGHSTRHPAARAALDALARPHDSGNDTHHAPAHPSTAVDTALALRALAAAGDRAGSDPVVDRALDRLGDRGVPAPRPDVDATALVLTALHRVGAPRSRETDTAVSRSVRWLLERQSANGGWSRRGVRQSSLPTRRALAAGPGAADDVPSPSVTAHVIEALCAEGYAWHPAVRRAVRLLLAEQAIEGFWEDHRDGRLHATTQVLLALDAVGLRAGHLAVEGAMEWIYQRQNPDGGWSDGASPAPGATGRAPGTTAVSGPSAVAQTARCLIAAHTTGVRDTPRLDAAVAFLLRRRSEDGGWTGAGERPATAHPHADIRTDAHVLWAIALHAAEQEGRR
ncbi:prenyltransferase/squalene oxidase repeat-containing protein [Streptomyces sp.]|uniref:prenyltransferase/squalene oxidase repeat-containing protein n=1 Tax=Streptomyces sp. TaxID=1931 RepID=UPI002D6C2D01|nr:prenyltransferase/squalene oxidase repeat-containing protein [Streptomyces sp.]HZF91528.1 prenyltransferase/squalene oxidase repeat-containing protein [Streptomyces sp.]